MADFEDPGCTGPSCGTVKNCCVLEHHQAAKEKRYWRGKRRFFWRIREKGMEQSICERYPGHREPLIPPRSRLREERKLYTGSCGTHSTIEGLLTAGGEVGEADGNGTEREQKDQ